MITNSNPFLRNDYYPDQNDIDDLNTRINEVQSDVDLLAISVNKKTEAVNGRLNNLQNDYNTSFETEALKANLADLNVLNINVQATIKDLNAVNTYTENLIVNKPVQDLSLRTPHLENTTSLNGNFYTPNIIGGKIDNIQFENIQNFNAIEVKANKLIGDFSAEPMSSSAVVGYDENGQLIPIRASFDVSFPEYSDYLKTDAQGTARKGTSESGVVQSTNLIQAGAVQNMYDAVNANFNNVSNSFNAVNESFNAVNNTFIDYYTKTQADNKFVAQVAGKGLSDKNFTAEFETLLNTLKDEKWVKPVDGKGLSTNDFTTAEKNKLKDIEAEANKTEITQTLDNSETTVPSNKAVSDGLATKVNKDDIAVAIDSSNNTASDKVPSCAAVAAYIAELGLSSLSQKPICTKTANSITVSVTSKIGAVKVTAINSFNQSKVVYNSNPTATTLIVDNLSPNTSYFVEVYNFGGQPFKAQKITTLA